MNEQSPVEPTQVEGDKKPKPILTTALPTLHRFMYIPSDTKAGGRFKFPTSGDVYAVDATGALRREQPKPATRREKKAAKRERQRDRERP